MEKSYGSLEDFKTALKKWLKENPGQNWLGHFRSIDKPASEPFTSFYTDGISESKLKIVFQLETTRRALEKITTCNIEDFLILPPSEGNLYWRFDFYDLFNKEKPDERHGLYAYVKKIKKNPVRFLLLDGPM